MRGRGAGWVVAQGVVMALIAAACFRAAGGRGPLYPLLAFAGGILAAAGVALVVWAQRALGAAFTPFPEPRRGGSLVAAGPYRLARHPMYGGFLLVCGGVSLARSVVALALTALLAVLWWRKSIAEERRLESAYPDYAAYRQATPKRFLPFVA